ncbi:hypothetical protein JHK86_005515 [Glycine max]|nr:hypothetical protein JHK86_005515 [Glycine max]
MNPRGLEGAGRGRGRGRVTTLLIKCTLAGKWEGVIDMYRNFPTCQITKITESLGTALHVAVDMNKEDAVEALVNQIIEHLHHAETNPLEVKNKSGDTPLHVAASRGFAKICKIIIGKHNERKSLVSQRNNRGETPLFQAVINGHSQAFCYLSSISHDNMADLVRDNKDTILHCAISNEYFDLALIIVHYYGFLINKHNKEKLTPLDVLATRPSAFKSASKHHSLWKQILYNCILVEPRLDVERQIEANLAEMDKPTESDELNYPKNYATLYEFFARSLSLAIGKMSWQNKQVDTENPPINEQIGFGLLPPNYNTFQQFVRSGFVHILGLSGSGVGECSHSQELEEETRPQVDGNTDTLSQNDTKNETDQHFDEQNIVIIRRETKCLELLEEERKPKAKTSSDILDDDTVLVAARNGIVEIVNEILTQFISVFYTTNSQEENILLVAVRNKKPLVVENLRKKFQKEYPEVWNTLTLAVNKDGKTMLHMAAYASEEYKPWQISGSALQLMWDVNWFQQYIKSLVPEHYHLRSDKNNQTADEIFKEEHKELRKESSEWLKETSESCSVVAALVAGVSFATAATIPGGNDDKGYPHLEDKPAFHAFVISSVVGLGFSLTGLIMFLTILTSRKLYRAFRIDLPLKLLLGLSSLFVSIVALILSFCTSHSFLFTHKYKTVIFPIYVATCLPVTFYAVAQLPLYLDLLTFILFKVPKATSEGDSL